MNKKFLSAILFGALMVTSTGTFVSCKDYDDDIDRLDQEISNVKDAIKALEDKVGSGKYVESCTPFTDGNGGYEIKFSDGETIKLYNGAKGEQGEPGKPGTPGTPGTSADDYVVSVEEGESAYELVITYADGTKKTISMPKATSVVSGVKFIPTFLSEGEAARIHFPTIVMRSQYFLETSTASSIEEAPHFRGAAVIDRRDFLQTAFLTAGASRRKPTAGQMILR